MGNDVDPDSLGRANITRQGDVLSLNLPDVEAAGVPYRARMTPVTTRVWVANIQDTDFVMSFFDGPGRTTYFASRSFVAQRSQGGIFGLTIFPAPTAQSLSKVLQPDLRSSALLHPWLP